MVNNHRCNNLNLEERKAARRARTNSVFFAIVDHWEKYGISPTIKEIVSATDITSNSIVIYHLNILENENKIERVGSAISRNIVVVGSVWLREDPGWHQ